MVLLSWFVLTGIAVSCGFPAAWNFVGVCYLVYDCCFGYCLMFGVVCWFGALVSVVFGFVVCLCLLDVGLLTLCVLVLGFVGLVFGVFA